MQQGRSAPIVGHADIRLGPERAQPDATSQAECRGLAQIIDRVGDKWAVMVVGHLSEQRTLRFNELMRAIPGVSHRMLTLTLRGLEREGLVSRTAYATVPPRVDYALTDLGQSLTGPLALLAQWATAKRNEIEAARRTYDACAKSGGHLGKSSTGRA